MTSTVAAERAFVVFPRGEIREDALRAWRNRLRLRTNPDTGLPFTEDEIAAATVRESRWWIEADKDDMMMMAAQQRGLFLAQQSRPITSSSGFLRGRHGPLWIPEGPLPATGGSGIVSAPASIGSPFIGSTTIPDQGATWLRDEAGRRYQVLFDVDATDDGAGTGVDGALLTVKGIDTGTETNLADGTKLSYAQNAPLGVTGDPETVGPFKDGAAAETDADFAKRIEDRIAHKPASGNAAHFRHWARGADVSVADAFVYCAAFHANSVLVCVVAKRGTVAGPDGRIPSAGTLTAVTSRVVPPGSTVVPAMPHVLVKAPTKQSSNLVAILEMRSASSSGWTDATKWPGQAAGVPTTITGVSTQTSFQITKPGAVPVPPSSTPAMMVWDNTRSRLEKLNVQSVVLSAGNIYDVTLSSAPTTTLAPGMYVMPDNGKRSVIDKAIEDYFDSLGPGEVVNLSTDDRGHRAYRQPEPFEEYQQIAGSGVGAYLRDALQAALANDSLVSISSTTPTVPTDPVSGPALMVAGHVGVYPS